MLKGNLYDPIDCIDSTIPTKPKKVYRKDIFSILLVLVSDLDLVSFFFRDEL